MKFQELKALLLNVPKYPGTVPVKPGPMINEGYPSNFNLSFAWYEWTKKEGIKGPNKQYVSFAGDMFYTKCQPCIRPQDWKAVIDNDPNQYRYLSYFHMSDVSGLIAKIDGAQKKEIGIFSINSLIDFFKSQNIDINNVHVAYCQGGKVVDLTNGKYTFDKVIDKDPFYDDWINAGVPMKNMISDATRDTFLSLKNYSRPSPWGYRNEIFYNHHGKLLDIATVEHLCFEPTIDNELEIIDITDYKHAFSISAVGLERLLMVLNNFSDIRQVDIVAPLYDKIRTSIKNVTEDDIDAIVQSIRPIQAIVTDGGTWQRLNNRRREITRAYYIEFADLWGKYNLTVDSDLLTEILNLNANLLENDKMKANIDKVKNELQKRLIIMADNKHLSVEQRQIYRNVGGLANEH